ncbi:hypothetical protein EV126DRAFT_411609 [Verticillium dahliae]|nr:hypothetical protein EV126DRAFT_411609 [Verticillium dahliae]
MRVSVGTLYLLEFSVSSLPTACVPYRVHVRMSVAVTVNTTLHAESGRVLENSVASGRETRLKWHEHDEKCGATWEFLVHGRRLNPAVSGRNCNSISR